MCGAPTTRKDTVKQVVKSERVERERGCRWATIFVEVRRPESARKVVPVLRACLCATRDLGCVVLWRAL